MACKRTYGDALLWLGTSLLLVSWKKINKSRLITLEIIEEKQNNRHFKFEFKKNFLIGIANNK